MLTCGLVVFLVEVLVMGECGYRLSLKVVDNGVREFAVEREFTAASSMSESIAYEVASAFRATMDEPPSSMMMSKAMEDNWCSIKCLATAHEEWDAEIDFDECVRIVVDFDKLCGTVSEPRKSMIMAVLRRFGAVFQSINSSEGV
jgi:hypothetical protein